MGQWHHPWMLPSSTAVIASLLTWLHRPQLWAALWFIFALVTPAQAQDPAVLQALTGLGKSTTASKPSAASSAPQADPKLLQQAEQATLKDDERILAQVTARLARNVAFRNITPSVRAGVAVLTGSVPDSETRDVATKVVTAVQGVVAVENELVLAADFGARIQETWEIFKDRSARLVAATPLLLVAALIVLLANWAGRWLAGHLGVVRLDSRNPFLGTVVGRVVRTAFLVIGLLVALDLLGATALVTAVLGSAGLVGIVVGFAFRDMAENYLSGVLLSLRRPFEPRDHVRIDAHEGRVVSLSTRNTVLMTLDGNELLLPNATVFKAVILNYSHNPRRRLSFQLSTGSDQDLRAAQDLGVQTLAAMTGVLSDPSPSASIDTVGNSSVAINFFAWVDQRETDFGKTRSEAIRLVKLALDQAGMGVAPTVYPVKMLPPDAHSAAPEPATAPVNPEQVARTQADVSPSNELDEQLTQERARKAGQDMLNNPAHP
jgi:small-conductance mechanosensitive channel